MIEQVTNKAPPPTSDASQASGNSAAFSFNIHFECDIFRMPHHVFNVGDLVCIIAECIGNDSQTSKGDLLAFLLTCRTFCNPGINMLWKTLDDTAPLAYLFRSQLNLIRKIHTFPRGDGSVHWEEWTKEEHKRGELVSSIVYLICYST